MVLHGGRASISRGFCRKFMRTYLLRVSRHSGEKELAVDFQLNLNAETVARLDALPPVCVEPGLTVREVLKQLQARRRGTILVCREGLLVGIFTERDALKLMAEVRIWMCRWKT